MFTVNLTNTSNIDAGELLTSASNHDDENLNFAPFVLSRGILTTFLFEPGRFTSSTPNNQTTSTIFLYLDWLINGTIDVEDTSDWFRSIQSGNLIRAKEYLKLGINVECKNDSLQTALHIAAQEGHNELIELLITHKADPNPVDKYGNTPIVYATIYKLDKATSILIKAGANVNTKDANGNSLLYLAINAKNTDILQQLINAGADLNLVDKDGNTPLLLSVINENFAAFQILINANAKLDTISFENKNPLVLICKTPAKIHFLEFLINKKIKVDLVISGDPVIFSAIDSCNVKALNLLIKAGVNVNQIDSYGCSTLISACLKHSLPMIKLLVENGADINFKTQKEVVIESRNTNIWKFSLPSYHTFPKGTTVLTFAKKYADEGLQNFLISNGAKE